MIEQFGQHIDRDPGVSVSLGITVPVAVGRHLGFVDLDAVSGAQHRQGRDPLTVAGVEGVDSYGVCPWGFRRVEGSSVSSATAVSGNIARTRCCWSMITLAVASPIGKRRPRRWALMLS